MDTALIILVEQKLPSYFDMFIKTRNTALELSQSTMKPTFDDFCKGLVNEKERLIISRQISLNKALMTHNKNPKKIFNNAKGSSSRASNPTNKFGHASNAHH